MLADRAQGLRQEQGRIIEYFSWLLLWLRVHRAATVVLASPSDTFWWASV
jgi:hypothetical protein